MRQLLTSICWFGAAAGVWLAVMENVLRHQGYETRSIVAGCIVVQALATVLCVVLRGGVVVRALLSVGAIGMIWLGTSSILRMLRAPHFEGFVLVIGAALVLQGILTLFSFWRHDGEIRLVSGPS